MMASEFALRIWTQMHANVVVLNCAEYAMLNSAVAADSIDKVHRRAELTSASRRVMPFVRSKIVSTTS